MDASEITQLINQFFNSDQWIAILTAVGAYLVANIGIILVGIVKLISSKVNTQKIIDKAVSGVKVEKDKEIEAIKSEKNAIISEFKSFQTLVCKKFDIKEQEKNALIKEQAIELKTAVDSVKENLTIDDILNK